MVPEKGRHPANGAAAYLPAVAWKTRRSFFRGLACVARHATRVFIAAGIFHETHSFSGDTTGLESFVIGIAAAKKSSGRRGDVTRRWMAFCSKWPNAKGWELVAQRRLYRWRVRHRGSSPCSKPSGARVEPALKKALAEEPGCHPSVVAWRHGHQRACEDPEGELDGAHSQPLPGAETLPVYCVGDLHATLTPKMGNLSDCMIFYRECPHTDAFDSAVLSGNLLARRLKTGVRPKHFVLVTPIVWPPTGTGTRDGPMRALEDAARRMEKDIPGTLAVNIVGGYAFSDVPHAGVSFSIITEGDAATAQAGLRELARIAWTMREGGIPKQHDLDQVVREFQENNHSGAKGPVLVEPSDNIGGGAPGDGTDVMQALLKYDVHGAGVAIADPESVAALQHVPVGGKITLPIGGKEARSIPDR